MAQETFHKMKAEALAKQQARELVEQEMSKKEMVAETKKQQDELDKRMKNKPQEQGEHTTELTENEQMFLKKQEEDEKA
jgi:hypothetical protein